LIRFAAYDLYLYKRDKRKVQTVIIYSADVKKAADSLDIGVLVYAPLKVMMYGYDGNTIYKELETKLKAGHDLTDTDMLNLIFLPLMKNDIPKRELAEKSLRLAQTKQDKIKRDTCIASAFAFSLKYLNDDDITRILEVLKVANLETVLTRVITDERIEIAVKAIKKGLSLEDIADLTGLDIETVEALQEHEESERDRE
jgi:hypothetical protein